MQPYVGCKKPVLLYSEKKWEDGCPIYLLISDVYQLGSALRCHIYLMYNYSADWSIERHLCCYGYCCGCGGGGGCSGVHRMRKPVGLSQIRLLSMLVLLLLRLVRLLMPFGSFILSKRIIFYTISEMLHIKCWEFRISNWYIYEHLNIN